MVGSYSGKPDNSMLRTVFHRMFDPSTRPSVWSLHGVNHIEEEADTAHLEIIFNERLEAHFGYISALAQDVLQPVERENGSSYGRYEAAELPACIEKCFFILSNGLYGLCPWAVKEGDIIAILHGGSVAYLLRPMSAIEADLKYELVGVFH